MKKLHTRIAGSSLAIAMAAFLSGSLQAQISVTSAGAPADPFGALPPATSWSSFSIAGAAGTPEDAATLDTMVQGVAASSITAQVESNTGNPPGTSVNSRWSSVGFYLQTRPTVNAATLFMATLRNDSGGNIVSMTVNYDYQNRVNPVAAEVIPGNRVYYSLTGATGSWVPVGNFGNINDFTVQAISIPLDLTSTPWAGGSTMYLLFADDNNLANNDAANDIDNFAVNNVVGGTTTCVAITNQSGSITVPERGSASFSIMATGTPQTIRWYRDGVLIGGANSATYIIPSVVYPGDNGATFRATVSNSICAATSTVVTLTVQQDLTAPTLLSAIGELDPLTITLHFSEPISMNFDVTGFTVFETGTDPDASSYITESATLSNGTNIIVVLHGSTPRTPGVNYSIRVLDVVDASSANNQISPNPTLAPIRATVQLIGFDVDNEWKYDINNGDRTGTGWELPGFDDSAWPSGPAGLGLDVSANGVPIRTTLPYAANGVVTYYRRHFTLPSTTNGVVLTLRDVVEDGAVYYLNGKEVFRNRMPSGAVTFATLATGAPDPTPITGPFNLSITNLLPGDNVLAVEVHQSSATSTDVELAVELAAQIGTFLSGPPVINTQPQSRAVNEGQSVSFTVGAEGALPLHFQWRKDGGDLEDQTNATYAIASAVPSDAGAYTVVITNSFGSVASTAASLTVAADTRAPTIVSVVGNTNLSQIVVTLSDPTPGTGVELTSAQDPSHYQITSAGGNLTVISAVATNVGTNTIITLTTSPRTAGQNYTLTINGVTDRSVAANAVSPNTAPVAATIVLFTFNNTWRYDQSGSDLGTTWKETAFNDSAWPSGPGILGFETTSNTLYFFTNTIGVLPNGTNTVLSLTKPAPDTNRVITYYFRTTVNVPFDPAGATFLMRGYIDDGAILYINGTERLRYNMTNGPGYTNFANAALTEPTPAPSTTYLVTNLTGLVAGANVIAVEIHQDSLGSSDVDWGMQLEAQVTGAVTPPAKVNASFNPGTGQVTISWSGPAGCALQETTQLRSPSSSTVWSASSAANGVAFTPAGPMKFYRLACP